MNLPTKPSSVQTYQTILYRRALHPELFSLKARRTIAHGDYELELWLMRGAHLLRFSHKHLSACELVTWQDSALPAEGAITAFPCAGEHDFEYRFDPGAVVYMTSVQTEMLTDNLYNATLAEMEESAGAEAFGGSGLIHRYDDPDTGGKCLSMIDAQRFKSEVHVQCYHLVAGQGFVLRTQSIFEHR